MSMVNLPRHWKMARFGEVATFTKKPRGLQYSEYDEIPFVPMDLIPIAKLFSEQFTLKKNGELSSGTYFEPGDILLAKITPSFENGKQCVIKGLPTPFGIATTEVIPIREVAGVSDKFYLFYYLLMPDVRTLLAGRMQGTTGRQRLGKETLVSLEIPLPPLPEQRAIAHVLQTIQEAKAARQRELALERERKAALMDYLFSYGTKGEPRKQTEIGEIPESWEVVKLGKVCSVKTSFPSFKKIRELESHNVDDDVVFALKVSDMNTSANQKYITESQWAFYCIREQIKKRRFLKPCSIIFPKRGAAIRTNKKRITTCYSVLDPNLIGVQLPNNINLGYLFGFFECFDLGTLQDNNPIPQLNKKDVEGVVIPLPPYSEQQEIAEILNAFDTKIAALEQETERLDELFHAMLDELMTGKRSAVPLIDAEMSNWKTLSNQE